MHVSLLSRYCTLCHMENSVVEECLIFFDPLLDPNGIATSSSDSRLFPNPEAKISKRSIDSFERAWTKSAARLKSFGLRPRMLRALPSPRFVKNRRSPEARRFRACARRRFFTPLGHPLFATRQGCMCNPFQMDDQGSGTWFRPQFLVRVEVGRSVSLLADICFGVRFWQRERSL